jgi:hypothetical protein
MSIPIIYLGKYFMAKDIVNVPSLQPMSKHSLFKKYLMI